MRFGLLVCGCLAILTAESFLAANTSSIHAAEPSGSDRALAVASQTGRPVLAVCGAGG